MTTIILSYRRDDTSWIAGRIHDRLKGHYGSDCVFMDIDSIPFGLDFREHIHESLKTCDILLAIIGPDWTAPNEEGQARLFDETDWVRIEIETALAKKIPVIPVLIDGTRLPPARDLPEGVRDIVFRQAADVDAGRDFHAHMDRLIGAMDQLLARRGGPALKPAEPPPPAAKPKASTPSGVEGAEPPRRTTSGAAAGQGEALAAAKSARWSKLGEIFFSLRGRLARMPFWSAVIVTYALMFIFAVLLGIVGELAGNTGSDIPVIAVLSPLLWIWVLVAIGVKRLHDLNWSGLWVVIPMAIGFLVPEVLGLGTSLSMRIFAGGAGIAACVLLALGFPQGSVGPNRYGADPLAAGQGAAKLPA